MIRQHLCGRAPDRLVENFPTETFAAVEIAAGLRPVGVDGAEHTDGIEGDAGAVAALVHAACAGVLDDKLFRHHITHSQFDHQMAATAAAGAGGKIRVEVDGSTRAAWSAFGEL